LKLTAISESLKGYFLDKVSTSSVLRLLRSAALKLSLKGLFKLSRTLQLIFDAPPATFFEEGLFK
jgi:hypothetical protein